MADCAICGERISGEIGRSTVSADVLVWGGGPSYYPPGCFRSDGSGEPELRGKHTCGCRGPWGERYWDRYVQRSLRPLTM